MAVKIRLQRGGAKRVPFYHVVVADSRVRRDGTCIEKLGFFDPQTEPVNIQIDAERAKYWLSTGAQPTDTARALLKKAGIIE
ncbi:MAG: 30S ribosomal protein S16 [Clostridia bacterium]|jgi:small subunit ribosomal protein S16|nr:30S ribosomal protein S16 [Clostridia bacterium]